MKRLQLIVARITDSSDRLFVVPFWKTLDFSLRQTFTEVEFAAFLQKLGMDTGDISSMLQTFQLAPTSFELQLQLSEPQVEFLRFRFPALDRDATGTN